VLTLLSILTPKTPAALNGLTLPRILKADVDVETPSKPDLRTTRFDVSLLATTALLLATFGRHLDVDALLIKNSNLLKTRVCCQFFVDKKFELRLEVCDKRKSLAIKFGEAFLYKDFSKHKVYWG